MIKYALVTFALIGSTNAHAISNEELIKTCLEAGKAKVISQAEAYGCKVDISQLEAESVDNRWYNPSKYVWYQVVGECNGFDRVIQLVQYYNGRCF